MHKIAAYDADGIWGVGDTEDQARAEADGFIRGLFDDPNDEVAESTIRALRCSPISDEMVGEMHLYGAGFEFFALVDGMLVPSDAPFSVTREAQALLEAVS